MYSPILQHPTLDTLGLISSLFAAITSPFDGLNGASGGAYALLGAQYAVVLMNWKDMQLQWDSHLTKVINSGYFRLSFIVFLGFLLGVIVLRPRKMERWLKIIALVCAILLTILVLMSVTFLSICGRSGWCPPIKLD
ncbi:unnamed protein product [Hymenolepis diminuta]|uniref:Rhomboid domain-containing protein n=1 Tax=Hymenolepis diminuta TaxID=6216 RepID=A0A0R3SY51_HYMDI|nr:unnamed protein product [Hymenolepis diminuta]